MRVTSLRDQQPAVRNAVRLGNHVDACHTTAKIEIRLDGVMTHRRGYRLPVGLEEANG